MDRRAAITYGLTGQSLELYPPEWTAGAPSSVTFAVYEGTQSDDDAVQFSGSGSVDTVSTTLDASAGAAQHAATGGRRRVPLTATTNIVQGRDYLITNAVGQRERVRVATISSGAYVEVEHDLAYDYVSTDTFVGLRMTAAIDNTFAVTESALNYPESPYRVLWTYTVGGIVRKHWSAFDLVRAARKHGVTVEDLFGEWPTILHQIGNRERLSAGRDAIEAGWRRFVTDLKLAGIDPNAIRDPEMVDQLVKESALMTFADRGECPPNRDPEQWTRERAAIYKRDLEKVISGNKLLLSEGLDGAITTEPARAGWFVS